jgi:hypothetical protein
VHTLYKYAGRSAKLQKSSAVGKETISIIEPRMGIAMENVTSALELLRALAVTYFVTAQQVDLLCELFDDSKDKVALPLWRPFIHIVSLLHTRYFCNLQASNIFH